MNPNWVFSDIGEGLFCCSITGRLKPCHPAKARYKRTAINDNKNVNKNIVTSASIFYLLKFSLILQAQLVISDSLNEQS